MARRRLWIGRCRASGTPAALAGMSLSDVAGLRPVCLSPRHIWLTDFSRPPAITECVVVEMQLQNEDSVVTPDSVLVTKCTGHQAAPSCSSALRQKRPFTAERSLPD